MPDALSFCPNCGQTQAGRRRRFRFHGDGKALFFICVKYLLLALVTLGIAWFWGRAETRRYLYSQTELDGSRFEYHGTGRELFVGWLKAFGIYLFLLGQMIFWRLLLGESGIIVGGLVFFAGLIALIALGLVGAWRYRANRSAYRGVRFSFRAGLVEGFRATIPGMLLTAVTLGFYTPFFLTNLQRFLVNNTWYGNEQFRFDGEGRDLFPPFLGSILLALPTLWISTLWFRARQQIYYWSRSSVQGARLEPEMRPIDLTLTVLVSYVLTAVTLGIAAPWARVMRIQWVCDRLAVEGNIDFPGIRQRALAAGATGEGIAEFFDTGAGLEL